MTKFLNVIALNIPYPANYGGVIDIYYKLLALSQNGVRIILHCFEYERPHAPELEEVCQKVYYYKRHTGLLRNLSYLPYNVYSRKDPVLLHNLLSNDHPILFEGLHSCYYLNHPKLRQRFKILRMCNIEHDYYHYLAESESNTIHQLFFRIEAFRFKRYLSVIRHANLVLAVSLTDTRYLQQVFPNVHVEFMPCFHANDRVTALPGQSDYILYHGKLSVIENERAARYLVEYVFSQLPYRCVIAGMDPSPALRRSIAPYPHISLVANPDQATMDQLIREAQIHMLITFQPTGLKLKLLNSLFAGRHTIVNHAMLAGSGLDTLCCIADTPEEIITACHKLMRQPLNAQCLRQREFDLLPAFSNQAQGMRLKDMLPYKE